jgi:hypothetical protein
VALNVGTRNPPGFRPRYVALAQAIAEAARSGTLLPGYHPADPGEFDIATDNAALHLLLKLPESWRAEQFSAHMQQQGVAVLPSSEMLADPGGRQNVARLIRGASCRQPYSSNSDDRLGARQRENAYRSFSSFTSARSTRRGCNLCCLKSATADHRSRPLRRG